MAGSATQRTALFSRQQVGGAWTIDDYQEHPGDLWFVDSTHARAANAVGMGRDPDHPFATIHYANTQAADNNGDVIYVAPKHAEDIDAAGAITLDKQGMRVIGLGIGDDRPTLTWSDTVSTLAIDDCDILVKNFRFVQGINTIVVMVDVNGDDFTLLEDEFVEAAGLAAVSFVDLDGGGANACDNFKMIRCRAVQHTAGADQVVDIAQIHDGIEIRECVMDVDCVNACIYSGSAHTDCVIAENYLHNRNAGEHAIEFSAAATGFIVNNRLAGDTIGTILDPGSCHCAGNLEVGAINTPGVTTPVGIVDHDANIEGANNANNAFDSSTVAFNGDGSIIERLEYLQQAQEVCVLKADGAQLNGDDPIFTVAGGPVLVTHFFGLVTTVIGANVATMQIQHDVTAPAVTVNLSTAVAIEDDTVGTSYHFTAATPSVLTPTPNGCFDQVPENHWFLPIGTMQAVGSAANTGVIAWYMVYKPLSPASVVTAAA
jgi:hypothetical protein